MIGIEKKIQTLPTLGKRACIHTQQSTNEHYHTVFHSEIIPKMFFSSCPDCLHLLEPSFSVLILLYPIPNAKRQALNSRHAPLFQLEERCGEETLSRGWLMNEFEASSAYQIFISLHYVKLAHLHDKAYNSFYSVQDFR